MVVCENDSCVKMKNDSVWKW